jgi:transcription elongation factor Elf1
MPEKRTYAHRAEYLKKAVAKRRKRLKQMVVEYKGGECVICGYSKYAGAFDLHHLDESKKEFALSSHGLTRSWERVKKEADKCVLLCANCHRELHGGITQLPREILGRKTR